MKKIMIAILATLLTVQVVFAEYANIVIDRKTASPGDVVEIDVRLENNPGMIAALFSLTYDTDRLTLIGAADSGLLQGGTFSPDCNTYPYIMVWNSAAQANVTDNGKLVSLAFEVLDTASPGNAFISLSYRQEDVFDVDLNDVPLVIEDGTITVAGAENEGRETESREPQRMSSGSDAISGLPNQSGVPADEPETDLTLQQIILTIGEKDALVFGEVKTNDVAPILRNDRTMLPARFVAENLGAMVEWQETGQDSGAATITKDDISIVIVIGSEYADLLTKAKKVEKTLPIWYNISIGGEQNDG